MPENKQSASKRAKTLGTKVVKNPEGPGYFVEPRNSYSGKDKTRFGKTYAGLRGEGKSPEEAAKIAHSVIKKDRVIRIKVV